MEDLLPLIIAVLWLVYTFYSKGRKKKAQQRSPSVSNPRKKPTFFEQLLASEGIQINEPVFVEEEEPFHEDLEEPVSAPVAREKIRSSPFLKTELARFREEGQAQFQKSIFEDGEDEITGDFSSPELKEMPHDFNLKKAVIFSTILDAPYIDYK